MAREETGGAQVRGVGGPARFPVSIPLAEGVRETLEALAGRVAP